MSVLTVCVCVMQFSASSINCLFAETPSENNYIKYTSVYNPDWAMGFNRRGRAINEQIGADAAADEQHRRQLAANKKCYLFVKRPVPLERHD